MYLCVVCGNVMTNLELCPDCGLPPVTPDDFNLFGIDADFGETYGKKRGKPLGQSDHYIIKKKIIGTDLGGIFNDMNGLLGLIIRQMKGRNVQLVMGNVYGDTQIEIIKHTQSAVKENIIRDGFGRKLCSIVKSVFDSFNPKIYLEDIFGKKEFYATGNFNLYSYNVYSIKDPRHPVAIIRPLESMKKKGIAKNVTIDDSFMVKMSTNLGKIGQSKILGIVMLVQEELEMVA